MSGVAVGIVPTFAPSIGPPRRSGVWEVQKLERGNRDGDGDPPPVRSTRIDFERLFLIGLLLALVVVLASVAAVETAWSPAVALVGVVAVCAVAARDRGVGVRAIATGLFPRSWSAAVVGAVVGVSLVAAVLRLPGVITSGYESLTGPSYSLSQADIEPLGAFGSVPAVAAAARTIPVDATYSVIGGDKFNVWQMFEFWLAPRVFTPDYLAAPWVIVYGLPPPARLPHGKKFPLAPGIYALEVAR
jgi:hypothetical protein